MMKRHKNGYSYKKRNDGVKTMLTIGNYTLMIVKKNTIQPVRLEKQVTNKEHLEQLVETNSTKINIILFILLLLLFMVLCYMVVPQTYGFYHW